MFEVLVIEVSGHGARHLHTLHTRQVTVTLQVKPVGLVQLGTWRQEREENGGTVHDNKMKKTSETENNARLCTILSHIKKER